MMKKVNKKIVQAVTLSVLMMAPCSVWADDFTDGFSKDLVLNQPAQHSVGVAAPDTDTMIDKDIVYDFTLNQGTQTTNSGVSALFISQNGKNFTYDGKADVSVSTNLTGTGNNSANAICLYAGNVTFNNDAQFTTIVKGENGKSAYGISALGGNDDIAILKFNGNTLKINVMTDVARQEQGTYCEAAGISAYAADVIASKNTKTEISVTGTSTSDKATPVYGILNEAGNVDLKGDTVIKVVTNGYGTNVTSGKDAAGLAVGVKVIDGFYNSTMGNTSGKANTTLGNAFVTVVNNAEGGKAIGMEATNFVAGDNYEAVLKVDGNLDLTATADTARGIIAQDGKKVALGGNNSDYINIKADSINANNGENVNVGIWAVKSGTIDINTKSLNVITNATGDAWAYGISAQNNSTDAADNLANININADNIYVSSTSDKEGQSAGLVTMSQGQMNVHGNIEVHGDNAIITRGDSVLNINTDETDINNTTKLYGDINFAYDEKTSGTKVDADVNINLSGTNSVWEGNTMVDWALKNEGSTTYEDIKDKLSVDSCNITLSNGAQWNATQVNTTGTDGKQGSAYVALNNLTLNNGIINLDKMEDQELQIENISGIGIVNVASNENKMAITKSIAGGTQLTAAATSAYAENLVQNGVEDGLQQVAQQIKDNTGAEEKIAATNAMLAATSVTGVITAEVNENGEIVADSVKEGVNTSNDAISNMASIALMTWRAENNDMNKRLGELRDSKGEHGVWARMVRGEGTYKSIKNQYNTYQLGYDEKLSTNKNWTVGAALSYTEGESSFNGGSGENKHTGLSVYGSYLNDDGSFIDLIAKYARLDHDFDVIGGAGSGDYETNGYSVSAEYGKRFKQDNGMWIEPQVELTYGKIGSVNYMTDNGVSVNQDGMDSLVGRVGFALGKDFKQGNAYVRASYLYDFDGETDIRFTKGNVTRGFEQDLGGGWWEVGVGTNLNLSDATHLYFDIEKTYGGDVATPWQWNAGIRYSF